MLNEPLNPTTPTGSEPGDGTSIEKFKNDPAKRDEAYLELEKLSKDQARRLAELEKRWESFEVMPQQPAAHQPSFTDLYPGSQPVGSPDQNEAALASRILTRPSEVLNRVYERAVQDTMSQVSNYLSHIEVVNRFKSDNPDLAKHEEIVSMFVKRQPTNLSPDERLRRAAPEARRYLADIAKAGSQAAPALDPSTYVEAPTTRPTPAAPAPQTPSDEDELSEMIRERSAIANKKRL